MFANTKKRIDYWRNMTKKLYSTPVFWLNLDVCSRLFEDFRETLKFDEPIPDFSTRFPGKLEGILNSVKQTFGGEHLNPTILDASAAYFNQFVRGHAFINGNKRMAVLFTHFFLLVHDIDFSLKPSEMYTLAIIIARAGEDNIDAQETKQLCKKIIEKFTERRK